jgi:hypothetical protein
LKNFHSLEFEEVTKYRDYPSGTLRDRIGKLRDKLLKRTTLRGND